MSMNETGLLVFLLISFVVIIILTTIIWLLTGTPFLEELEDRRKGKRK